MSSPPANLAPGWTAHLDPTGTGHYYYYNAASGESTWHAPLADGPSSGSNGNGHSSSNGTSTDYSAAWEKYNREHEFRGREDRMGDLGRDLYDVNWKKENLQQIARIGNDVFNSSHNRSAEEVKRWRQEHEISCSGRDVPDPVLTFEETNFPEEVLGSFKRQGFKAPTCIQSQGWSAAMTGRDIVGIAKTGSGKTLAFGIPAIIHLRAQPAPRRGDGPGALILAPTRELAVQIEEELNKVIGNSSIRAVCCYGGAPKHMQQRALYDGVDIVIATPGRLIDFLENRSTNLKRVTYLVMDEADRMLDMGFEPQIRKIVGQVRPDRQTLLWSATWPREVQGLAQDFLKDWVQIQVGSQELSANKDVTQHIHFVSNMGQKYDEMFNLIREYNRVGKGKILVFTGTKRTADDAAHELSRGGNRAMAIHGDKSQRDRERVLQEFRHRSSAVLVATDVAARGLDIRDLNVVINFDFPGTLEDYVHRIGRTGRAGAKGDAHTFFGLNDARFARGLLQLLRKAGQQIPPQLEDIARNPPPPGKGGKGGRKGGGKGSRGGDYGGRSAGGGYGAPRWSPPRARPY